ncbi:MAG: DUF4405 domain-containing protein [Desulfofustis sp.]|nr:DUF4405 domain-containing protein [Desulfofustis sp.]
MNMRKITSMTMVWSLIVLVFNSIVLYVVPEGRIANWADWRFWGLDKHDWSAQHTTVGFLFIFAAMLHIYYNWKPILNYMKDKAKKFKVFTAASGIGLGLTVIFVVGTYLDVPPMSTIVEFSEQIKEGAAQKYGDPPYGQAQSSSLKGFTSRMGLDLNRSMELLRDAGIEVTDDKEMVQDIAERSGNTPQQIYDIIKPAGIRPAAEGADTHSEDGADKAMDPPKSGMGKKTITQLCEEIGQDCDMIIAGLKQRGMTIDPEQKLKDLAAENGTGPMQIYEAMVEIVNENKGQ